MPTIKDVARLAGVSHTTVSHTINKTRYVAPETKARVLAAIEKLDYRPRSSARSLRGKRTGVLGLVIPDIANPFYLPIVRHIERTMNRSNYNVILCNTEENPERERTYIQLLRQREVDGLIIAPTCANHDLLCLLHTNGKPVILIDRHYHSMATDHKLPAVVVDNRQGSQRATGHLIDLGHKEIAIVLNNLEISTTIERRQGYLDALQAAQITPNPAYVLRCPSRLDEGKKVVSTLLSLPNRPSAIFATDGPLTIGAMLAIRDQQVSCPDEISLVGFDDLHYISPLGPAITTVSQPVQNLGEKAAELFLKHVNGEQKPGLDTIYLDTQFVIGETTAPPRPH